MTDVKPLANLQAEEALVGIMLTNPDSIIDCQELVKPEEFFYEKTRSLFTVICQISDAGGQVDALTVGDALPELYDDILELAVNALSVANIKSYSSIVSENATKRRVLAMARTVADYIVTKPEATKTDVVNFAQSAMIDFETNHQDGVQFFDMKTGIKQYVQCLDARHKADSSLTGYSTGFEAIDEVTNGWRRGELIIIAGRPSMGKSTYALQSASMMSISQKLNGLFFSLEMSSDQLMEKLIACHGNVPLNFLKAPAKYPNAESCWPMVELGARRIKDAPFNLVHCPGIHINQLRTYARKAHRRQPLDFIAVDHIHLMDADGQSRERQLASISGGLKTLAGQLNIPVLALAQLNRGVEQRQDKRPMMSDLRDSGSIEQDADIIQFVYRDDYYNDDEMNQNKGLVLIDTVKHRMGQNGPAYLENRYDVSKLEPTNRYMQFNQQKGASKFLKNL